MTWLHTLLLVGLVPVMLAVVVVIDRLSMVGARRCAGTVIAVQVRRGITGSPPYVPLIHRTTTVRYHDHTGHEHTFRHEGSLRAAVGDTVTVAHRRHRPRLARVASGPPPGPVTATAEPG